MNLLRDSVYGWDLNYGQGFESFDEARRTWDDDNPPIGKLFKIRGSIYQVVIQKNIPVFHFYDV
jgi:hypothetical protein